MIIWTISGYKTSPKGYLWTPSQTFATKREAVAAMMSSHEPKTAITRTGHDYVYQMVKD